MKRVVNSALYSLQFMTGFETKWNWKQKIVTPFFSFNFYLFFWIDLFTKVFFCIAKDYIKSNADEETFFFSRAHQEKLFFNFSFLLLRIHINFSWKYYYQVCMTGCDNFLIFSKNKNLLKVICYKFISFKIYFSKINRHFYAWIHLR